MGNLFDICKGIESPKSKMKVHELPQFTALQSAASSFKSDGNLHLRNLCSDSSRCAGLVATHSTDNAARKIIIDYSRQQVSGETMELLFDLADKVGFTGRRDGMRDGSKINVTEGRSVLHHALRMPKGYDYSVNPEGKAILDDVHAVRDKIEAFTNKVRSGEFVGATGKALKNFVCIGIGGSQLGPEFVSVGPVMIESLLAFARTEELTNATKDLAKALNILEQDVVINEEEPSPGSSNQTTIRYYCNKRNPSPSRSDYGKNCHPLEHIFSIASALLHSFIQC